MPAGCGGFDGFALYQGRHDYERVGAGGGSSSVGFDARGRLFLGVFCSSLERIFFFFFLGNEKE